MVWQSTELVAGISGQEHQHITGCMLEPCGFVLGLSQLGTVGGGRHVESNTVTNPGCVGVVLRFCRFS